MVRQLDDFAAAVRDGHDAGSNPMEHQLLTQRFLEECYSLSRIQGSAGGPQ